jgi:HEAT repeat protein
MVTGAPAIERRAAALAAALSERRARWVTTPAAPGASAEWIDRVAAEDALEAGAVFAAAGKLKVQGAETLLLAHARDPRTEVRAGAVEGLSWLASGAARDAVAAALDDPAGPVRTAAADGLARAGARGAAALAVATTAATTPGTAAGIAGTPEWRITLARALGETGSVEAIAALTALLDGPSAASAAAALARVGAPAAMPPLVAYLSRREAPARAEVIEALALLVARDAAPAIANLLTDDRPDVRAAAARALGRLRHEPASARLEALRSDYYGRVRRAAVDALAKLPSGLPRARR